MKRHEAEDRIQKLKDLINDYRYHYHVLNQSIISEEAADSLKHELSQLEQDYPDLISPDSPTQRVAGSILPGFVSVSHNRRMLSLNDVFSEEELLAWEKRIKKLLPGADLDFFADIKMDGLACALIYDNGQLTRGVTRGDGFTGEDVTANIRTIESIPLSLRRSKSYPQFLVGTTEIRGEIVMYKADFAELNIEREKKGLPRFANPRNTAAGTIRQLDPALVATRKLHFRAYDLLRDDLSEVPTNSFAYAALADLGLAVNKMASVFKSVREVKEFADIWAEKRTGLAFNTDGLVVKLNDRSQYEQLGVAGKAPRAAVAYKYAAEQATTKVKDIFISIGRTGTATPVAILEPVVIAGSTVQMATLHNESEVKRKDIRVGDSVIVHKAGDVIPEIVQSLETLRNGSEKEFVMPKNCPICSTKLVKRQAKDAAWRCPNQSCPSRAWKQIEHFASKEGMDIEGLGEKNVIALLDAGLIKDAADIYTLKPEQLIKLDRFAEISADKLVMAINEKKNPPLDRFIYGLGIQHIGAQTAIDLANHFRSLDGLKRATIDELSAISGIGVVMAEAVAEYFSEPKNQQLLAKFNSLGVSPKTVSLADGKLTGVNFVVTGTLESLSRDEAASKIRALGGVFQPSVTKDTNYLVVGDSPGASKLKRAQSLDTKILDEASFLKLLD